MKLFSLLPKRLVHFACNSPSSGRSRQAGKPPPPGSIEFAFRSRRTRPCQTRRSDAKVFPAFPWVEAHPATNGSGWKSRAVAPL